MKCLLLDGSFLEGVIALFDDTQVIKEEKVALGPLANEDLAVYLEKYLKEGVTGLALGVGPGSYTGMRVAASLLLPLAYAKKIPLMTFCSLQGISATSTVVADGKRGMFYTLNERNLKILPLSELPHTFVSPQPLKKIYPALEGYQIEHSPFKTEHLLLYLKKKWEEQEFVSPLQVKLNYLQ